MRGSHPKGRCNLATGFPPRAEAVGDRSPLRSRPDGALTRIGMATMDRHLSLFPFFFAGLSGRHGFVLRCSGLAERLVD